MIISRWKLMTGLLGLSLGGLAVCSGQQTTPPKIVEPEVITLPPPTTPVTNKPNTPVKAPETLPPMNPEKVTNIEILVPMLPPTDVLPVKAEESVKKAAPKKKETTPTIKLDNLEPVGGAYEPTSTQPVTNTVPLNPEVKTVPSDVKSIPTPIPQEIKAPVNSLPIPEAKTVPAPETVPLKSSAKATSSGPLKMLVRIGSGTPRFEIRHGSSAELLLKVYGEKIEMQSNSEGSGTSPLAGVKAIGKVRFTGPGVEGTCDSLTVLSGTGEVLLSGNVSMKTKRGRSWSELAAEKMIYQIGVEGSGPSSRGSIVPTSYQK
jgi:hypothetical protein